MSRGLEYVVDPYAPVRRRTREVRVGDVGIGGDNPIRVQSMTTTDTRDTEATVAQTLQLAEAGCEIVRVTAPSITEAENLANIRIGLRERGCNVPLVADIHFTPNAALVAAWLTSFVALLVATAFTATYLYSFIVGGVQWLRGRSRSG